MVEILLEMLEPGAAFTPSTASYASFLPPLILRCVASLLINVRQAFACPVNPIPNTIAYLPLVALPKYSTTILQAGKTKKWPAHE